MKPDEIDVLDASWSSDLPPPPGAADAAAMFRARHLELVRLATMLVGDQATAEDVVQDVYVRICAGKGSEQFAVAYFRTAVINGCRSVHRRRSVASRFGRSVPAPLWDEPHPSAESAVVLADDRRRLLGALATLPRRQREAL